MMVKLYAAFGELDATLIEVNPLVATSERDVVALTSKTTIDNSALYRHEDIAAYEDLSAMDPQERMAKEKGSPTSSSTATSASSPTEPGSACPPWTWSPRPAATPPTSRCRRRLQGRRDRGGA